MNIIAHHNDWLHEGNGWEVLEPSNLKFEGQSLRKNKPVSAKYPNITVMTSK